MPSNKLNKTSNECFSEKEVQLNSATIRNNKCEGKFVRANFINLSSRHFSKDEVSFLSKGPKFVSTPKHIKTAKIKEEIDAFGRCFWNDHQEFDIIYV